MVKQIENWETDQGRVFPTEKEAIKDESWHYGMIWGIEFVIQEYQYLAGVACGGQGDASMYNDAKMLHNHVEAELKQRKSKNQFPFGR